MKRRKRKGGLRRAVSVETFYYSFAYSADFIEKNKNFYQILTRDLVHKIDNKLYGQLDHFIETLINSRLRQELLRLTGRRF